MRRLCLAVFLVIGASVTMAAPKFIAVWKAPDVSRLNFAGKKVAALVITDDESLQMSGEEALNRELTARGVNALAAYRIVPREELKSAEKAKGWFERAGVEGVVALKPVRQERERSYTPAIWSSSYYQTFWGYYGYSWGSVYVPGSSEDTTTVVVETLIFSVPRDQLLWAATSETKNPKQLQSFIKELVSAAANEMKKMKLVG
jgi:hypothetical protein